MDIQQNKILHFKDCVDTFEAQIDKIIELQGVGLSCFILCCCLIDTLSFYSIDEYKNSDRYKSFIKEYLSKVNKEYLKKDTAQKIYHGLRCALIHAYSISRGIILAENIPTRHLTADYYGNILIDLKSFYQETLSTKKMVYKNLSNSIISNRLFLKRYIETPPFEVYKSVDILDAKNLAASGTIGLPIKSYKVINYERRKKYQ